MLAVGSRQTAADAGTSLAREWSAAQIACAAWKAVGCRAALTSSVTALVGGGAGISVIARIAGIRRIGTTAAELGRSDLIFADALIARNHRVPGPRSRIGELAH